MRTRLLTAVMVMGAIGFAFVPIARAGGGTLTPSLEAWYQPDPACAQATGCLSTNALPVTPPVAVPTTPYPSGSLHVGYVAGQETARSFLAFAFDQVTGTLTGAQLDVPLDTAPADGDLQSSTATVQACLATGSIDRAEGSLAQPPTVDCSAHADLTYVATPAPHLHGDLLALTPGLPTSTGIALLPDAAKAGQTAAWHVTFSAHDRTDSAKTPPASLTLTTEDAQVSTPDLPTVDVPAPQQASPPAFVAPPPLTGTVQPPPAVDQAPQVSQPTAAPVVTAPRLVTVGYAYPAVWLLPLLLMLVVPLVAKGLTKDLTPLPAEA